MFQQWFPFWLMAQPDQGANNVFVQFLPIIAIVFVFYFLLIRPQQKKQKDIQIMRANLKKGDKIITTGGIFGQVVGIEEHSITLKIDDKTKIKVLKAAVAGKQGSSAEQLDIGK